MGVLVNLSDIDDKFIICNEKQLLQPDYWFMQSEFDYDLLPSGAYF